MPWLECSQRCRSEVLPQECRSKVSRRYVSRNVARIVAQECCSEVALLFVCTSVAQFAVVCHSQSMASGFWLDA